MFEIEPATGLVCFEEEDFSLNGESSFFFKRRYNNFSEYSGPFGPGWMHPYDVHLIERNGDLCFLDGEARQVVLDGLAKNGRVTLPSEDLVAQIVENRILIHQDGGKTLTFSQRSLSGGRLPLVRIDQTDENSILLSYHGGRLSEIGTTSFHRLRIDYRDQRIEHIRLLARDGREIILATYEYDRGGQLIAAYDLHNKRRSYDYSGGLLTRYTNQMGGSYYVEYDGSRRAVSVCQDGLSRYRKVLYDDRKRTRLVADSLGHLTMLRYNENNLLVEATLFDGSRVERAYTSGSEPISIMGAGPESVYEYDPAENVVEEVDPDGSVSKLKYDDRNRVVEEIDPDGGTTRYHYDECNRIIRQVDPLGGINVLTFDDNGNLLRHIQPTGNTVRATRYESGRMMVEDNLSPLYVSDRDAFGNTIRITTPSGRTIAFERDEIGRLKALTTNGATARKWYDANGFLEAETDLAGNRTEYKRDRFGLLLGWTNPLGRKIEYVYDSERRLVGARSSDGISCSYKYDARGRLVHIKLRDGREESMSYDENGLRSAIADSGGIITKYSYTPSGQLSNIESPPNAAHFEFDAGGNCVVAESDDHTVRRTWAPGDCLVGEQQDAFQIEYDHNVAGRIVLRRDSSGRVTRYKYDVRGQLSEISDSLFGVFKILRDHIQSKTEEILPNGIVRRYEYGQDDEISRVLTSNGGGETICERIYRYAPNGDLIEAVTSGAEHLRFLYDGEYNLTNVVGADSESESFAYDLDHNLIEDKQRGRYLYENGRLTKAGDDTYRYDGSGRVIASLFGGQVTNLSYSLGGLIREVVLPDGARFRYEYDGFGRRVLKCGPDIRIRYFWDQDVLLFEERETPQAKTSISYLFMPDTFRPIGHAVNGTCFYYELDQRSLVREVYNVRGRTVGRFAYRAYGERRTLELSDPLADSPFRLLGQIWDQETGLHYNRFRYYHPGVGRYLSPDLSTHQVEHNSYAYSPNPINWADPYGLMARFSTTDARAFVEEKVDKEGMYECSICGFKNTNRIFARTAESGRHVGDGCFQAGHKKAHANNGSGNVKRNAKVEGGTCNCSKGKRKEAGMT